MQTGHGFPIFQDRNDIAWGNNWKERIEEGLDGVTFLIPIITPSFFQSDACRAEFERFREREAAQGRSDLILPIYYVEAEEFSDEDARATDELAAELVKRQYADWRPLRFEPFTSPDVGRMLARMAQQIKAALPTSASRASPRVRSRPRAVEPLEAIQPGSPDAESRSPTTQSEPPTFVVDAMHRGDYATLAEAVAKAPAGSRIMVRPGYYSGGIVIDKPVEIIGDGSIEDIIITAKGAKVVLFKANMGRISNITIRQEGGERYAIDIGQGRLQVEDCDISSQGLSSIAVHGSADPVIRRNRIHDGKEAGLYIYDGARGTYEDNDVFANGKCEFAVSAGADPVVRRNRIHDGKEAGLYIYDGGRGTYEDNDIFGNALGGIVVNGEADPVVRRNRIHDGKEAGVHIEEGARGTFEKNHLWSNEDGSWKIATGAGKVMRQGNIEGSPDGWADSL